MGRTLAAFCLMATLALPARAAVDINGLFRADVYVTQTNQAFSDLCSVVATQSGATLTLTGQCQGAADALTLTGTIDALSGTLSASGTIGDCGQVTLTGKATGDSSAFSGKFDCSALGVVGGVNASRCGNGQIDAGENCDDGNRRNGDCCTDRCFLQAQNTGCLDEGNPCTTDACNAVGQCLHTARTGTCNDGNGCTADDACVGGQCTGTPQPDGAQCNDGNACTVGDHCSGMQCIADPVECPACTACRGLLGCVPAPANACKESPSHALLLRHRGNDSISWRWDRGAAVDRTELGDPRSGTDYDFCIYGGAVDANGIPGMIHSARAVPGANWQETRNGFSYSRPDRTPEGLRRMMTVAGPRDHSRVRAKSSGDLVALPPLQSLPFPLTVQLQSGEGETATCWSARYAQPEEFESRLVRANVRSRPATNRPNILIVSLDDTRADGIDRMPNLLAHVAGEGISFSNSFVVNPLCAPSRASLLSGLNSRRHGVRALNGPLGGAPRFRQTGADRNTIATWLHGAGYMTGLFGKYINGYGFGAERGMGPGGTYYVPDGWTRWRGMASSEHFGGVNGVTYTLVDEHGVPTVYDDHDTDAEYSTDLLAAQVREFMTDAVQAGQPFLAVWTPYASHAETPSLVPEPAARHTDLFRTLPLWRPPSFAEADISDKPTFMQNLPTNFAAAVFNDLIRAGAYESLLAVDEQIQLFLDHLETLGVADNTVIIFTSDNGTNWGEHRYYSQSKECPYEECLRVPLIVRDPRRGTTPIVRDAPILNIDIAPTVAELAGVVPGVHPDGVSFAAWLGAAPPATWRTDFLIEHVRGNRGDSIDYAKQPTDGDQLRLLYGSSAEQPRPSVLFEFDSGGGVGQAAVAVPIGIDEDTTFAALAAAVAGAVPFAAAAPQPDRNRVIFTDTSPTQTNLYLVVERDQAQAFVHNYLNDDWVGVRDVANRLTYVEHENGEVELYDLAVDPNQLESTSGDPNTAALRALLDERLDDLRQ